VERGELDLAFAMLPVDEGAVEAVELMRDPYVLVVQAGSPLAARATPPTLAEIAALPLIGFRQCRSIVQVDEHFRRAGAQPNVVFRSDDNGTVQGLVAAGVGAALVPRLTVDAKDLETAVVELDAGVPPRLIALGWHRDRYRSAAARAFVDTARELCGELEQLAA
jgi:DNA-binding transcriptional LysR family regulator